MISLKFLVVSLIAKAAISQDDQSNLFIDLTNKFLKLFPEEHYKSFVYVNTNEESDLNQHRHIEWIKNTSYSKTFTTYMKAKVYHNTSLVEPCKKYSQYFKFQKMKL